MTATNPPEDERPEETDGKYVIEWRGRRAVVSPKQKARWDAAWDYLEFLIAKITAAEAATKDANESKKARGPDDDG